MATSFYSPSYKDGIKQKNQTVFMGYNHTTAAADGDIYDMENMSGDEYPIARPRNGRRLITKVVSPHGLCVYNETYYASGTGFYRLNEETGESERLGTVADSDKSFACIGAYIVILPDKAYYNRVENEFGGIEAEWSGTASFADGTFAGEDAEGCRIITTGTAFPFKVGDAITISGAANAENNQTIIIREISDDKKSLGFYEHSFTNAASQSLTLKREMPDLDFVCENENRLWGCKDNTIYSSKLGDIFNWNVFDGLASDSYSVIVGSAGDFTGCISYLGYPIFFKEDRIYKVYGSKPSDYQVMSSSTIGVRKNCAKTLAVAGETLFYLSPVGMMAYTGGIPENISRAFGNADFDSGSAGSNGVKYYATLREGNDNFALFVYDTRIGAWYKEDAFDGMDFARSSGIVALDYDGRFWRFNSDNPTESNIVSVLEFADFIEKSPNRKTSAKLIARVELDVGSTVTFYISTDGGVVYKPFKTISSPKKDSYYLPISVTRYDSYRIKIVGVGMWRLYSLTREYSEGSPN